MTEDGLLQERLATDDDYGDMIEPRCGNSGHRIGAAGSGSHDCASKAIAHASVSFGREGCRLLVMATNVFDLLRLGKRVTKIRGTAASHGENMFDAMLFQNQIGRASCRERV